MNSIIYLKLLIGVFNQTLSIYDVKGRYLCQLILTFFTHHMEKGSNKINKHAKLKWWQKTLAWKGLTWRWVLVSKSELKSTNQKTRQKFSLKVHYKQALSWFKHVENGSNWAVKIKEWNFSSVIWVIKHALNVMQYILVQPALKMRTKDLQALNLCRTYCHKTGTRPLAYQTP